MNEAEQRALKKNAEMIADKAQLRSIENKRKNDWRLLPEDEEFLARKGTNVEGRKNPEVLLSAMRLMESYWNEDNKKNWPEKRKLVLLLADAYRTGNQPGDPRPAAKSLNALKDRLGLNKKEEYLARIIGNHQFTLEDILPPDWR